MFAYLFDKISFRCFDLHLQNSQWGWVSSQIFQIICILSFSENSLFVWLLALSLSFFLNLEKLFELRKLTLYLSCLFWIFSPTCYVPLAFGYGFFCLFVPYKCFKVLRCKILVSFMALGCTGVLNVCLLGRKSRPGIRKRKITLHTKGYGKRQGDGKMYKEFYDKIRLCGVLGRSCLSS